jgi:hypothetical protein
MFYFYYNNHMSEKIYQLCQNISKNPSEINKLNEAIASAVTTQ